MHPENQHQTIIWDEIHDLGRRINLNDGTIHSGSAGTQMVSSLSRSNKEIRIRMEKLIDSFNKSPGEGQELTLNSVFCNLNRGVEIQSNELLMNLKFWKAREHLNIMLSSAQRLTSNLDVDSSYLDFVDDNRLKSKWEELDKRYFNDSELLKSKTNSLINRIKLFANRIDSIFALK